MVIFYWARGLKTKGYRGRLRKKRDLVQVGKKEKGDRETEARERRGKRTSAKT